MTGSLGTLEGQAGLALVESAGALDALAAALTHVAAGGQAEQTLTAIATAAAAGSNAELAVVRLAPFGGGDLVARAVWAESAALAAEIEGSLLPAVDVGHLDGGGLAFPDDDGGLPGSVAKLAALAGAAFAYVVPVRVEGAVVGTLELYRNAAAFADDEETLARLAGGLVAVVAALTRTLVDPDAHPEQARASLDLLGDALVAGSDERETSDYVVRLAAEATGARGALLWRLEAETPPAFLAAHGFGQELPDLRAAAREVERAIGERHAVEANGRPGAGEGVVTLPLGEPPAGALQLHFDGPPEVELDTLSAFAARVGLALRRAHRAQLLGLALRRSQTLVAVVSQAIAQLSLAHTLDTAVERISELTGSGQVAVYLRDGGRLAAAASRGLDGPHAELAERLLELALGPFRSRGFLFVGTCAPSRGWTASKTSSARRASAAPSRSRSSSGTR